MIYKTILFFFIFSLSYFPTIKPLKVVKINAGEPSGISCYENDACIIASDNGKIFKYEINSNNIEKINFKGEDFEGVCVAENFIYLLEERSRKIEKFDMDFNHVNTFEVPYNGRLNRGYEGITFDPLKERFIIVTETNPCLLIELNKDFQVLKRKNLNINELSDITFFNNNYWLLSEQDHCIYVMDSKTYKIKNTYNINLIGAEGISISNNKLYITSDKLSKLYQFDIPD